MDLLITGYLPTLIYRKTSTENPVSRRRQQFTCAPWDRSQQIIASGNEAMGIRVAANDPRIRVFLLRVQFQTICMAGRTSSRANGFCSAKSRISFQLNHSPIYSYNSRSWRCFATQTIAGKIVLEMFAASWRRCSEKRREDASG